MKPGGHGCRAFKTQTAMTDLMIIDTIESAKVEQPAQVALKEKFLPFWNIAQEWKEKALELEVSDESQTALMQEARSARLALRQVRIDADKTRKALKEDSLRYGQAVQAVYNVIHNAIAPLEEHLERQENFAKHKERERQDALRSARLAELGAAAVHVAIQTLDNLGQLPGDIWDAVKSKALKNQAMQEAREAEAAYAEQERQAESARLRAENEAARKAIAEERAKAEAAAEAARSAQAAAAAAEQRAKAAEADALKEAAKRVWGSMTERKDWIAQLDKAEVTFVEILVILASIKTQKGTTGSERLDVIAECIIPKPACPGDDLGMPGDECRKTPRI